MDTRPTISQGRLAVEILLIVAIGIPLVAYLWETANHLFAGIVDPMRLAISVPMLVVFVLLLWVMRRALTRWEGERREHVEQSREADRE